MKVLAINGSMKAKDSCTDKILQPLLAGMQKAGAETSTIYLAEKNVKHCLGCMACWDKTPGKCVIKDDMLDVLEEMLKADLVIYGTPLYCYSASGLLKDCLDRSIPLGVPYQPSRYWTEVKKLLVSPSGFSEFENFAPLVAAFKRLFADKYIGEILRPAAELMRVEHFKPQYEQYCKDLAKVGEEIVKDGNISAATKTALNKLWVSPEEHRKMFEEKMKSL
jgi:hypothetical protein